MQYQLAFGFILNRTGGAVNLLLITVCNFIPILGPIVLLGYRAEVAQTLLRDDELRRHPKLDFNRFMEYLTRGVWPFITSLIVGVAAAVFVGIAAVVAIGIGIAANKPELALILTYAFMFPILIISMVASAPMTFHAELSGKFDLGAEFRFALSFWKIVGGQAIIAMLVFIPLSILVAIGGLLLCFVGVYPASALTQMAGQHILVQLYALYLERGGDPIPEFQPPERYDEEQDDNDRPRRRRRRDWEAEEDDEDDAR